MNFEAGQYRIEDLIQRKLLEIGDGYRAKNTELSTLGLPFARAGNINDGFRFDDADYFPEVDLPKVGKKVSKAGDVVFTSKGTVGRFAMVRASTPRFVYSPQLCFWRSLDQDVLVPEFLYYWMNSAEFLQQIGYLKGQTDMADYVSLRDQRKITATIPTTSVQRAVVAMMAPLDARIALLRETNSTLEAIAQALFKSWFVDFDPVRAKREGRLPQGMDEATAELFPDGFEESELGPVPRGWRVTTLADAFEINPKRSLKKAVNAPYLDMARLATSGHCVEAPIQRDMASGTKFRNGDTLLARITPCLENGKTAFVDFLGNDQIGWGSTEFVVLRPKTPMPEYFGYLLCRHPSFRDYAIQSMSGTSGRQRVQNDVLGRYLVAVADECVASAFAGVVEPVQKSIAMNHEMARTLAFTRDELLPRLISGQLRVPSLETFAGKP